MKCWSVNQPNFVYFTGEIGAFDDPAALLREVGGASDIEFVLDDADGGDARFAFQVFDGLRGRARQATILRRAVSASYVIACAADKILIERGAYIQIHAPQISAFGRKERIELAAQVIGELAERCIQTVSTRRRIKSKTVREWYCDDGEHVFTAQEAVNFGLVDEIFDAPAPVLAPLFSEAFPEGPTDDGKAAILMELLQVLGPIKTADPEKLRRELFHWQFSNIQNA